MKNYPSYLTGKCLVATPNMQDKRFENTLIYLCSHNKDGAMGFVVNKQMEDFHFSDLAKQLPIKTINPLSDIALHQGGPLEKVRGFVLHSTDYLKGDTVVISDDIAISSSIEIISDIAYGTGPKDNIIALGYASWEPEQLEQELADNDWLIVDSTPELVFRTRDEDKWQKAIDSLGFDIHNLSLSTGHA